MKKRLRMLVALGLAFSPVSYTHLIGDLLLYAVIPVTIVFTKLKYTGKSTLLQMWGHFILSYISVTQRKSRLPHNRKARCPRRKRLLVFFLGDDGLQILIVGIRCVQGCRRVVPRDPVFCDQSGGRSFRVFVK